MINYYEIPFDSHDSNEESNIITRIECCRLSIAKTIFFAICSITIVPLLLYEWFPKLRRVFLYSFCTFEEATHLSIYGPGDAYALVKIEVVQLGSTDQSKIVKKFVYRFFPYYYDETQQRVLPIVFDTNKPYSTLRAELINGIQQEENHSDLMKLHGPCQIEVPYKGVLGILVEEVLSPFYLFQIVSVVLWMIFGYYYYAAAILVISIVTVTFEVRDMRRNLLNIQKMARYECKVNVFRCGEYREVSSEELVPGDLIEIPKETRMPCDCTLLAGGAVVNEALLTGESIPVVKAALPELANVYNPDEDKRHTIYSGTEVLQTKDPDANSRTTGVVIRTGFATLKGSLIRYILYPKPPKFNFNSDSYKYLAVMFTMSIIGMVIQLISIDTSDTFEIVLKCLDLITITVPPALPACMSIGTNFALRRLKKEQIYCISPQRINLAGRITAFCFDKTGTLTEDNLTIDGYLPVDSVSNKGNSFQPLCTSVRYLAYEQDKLSANELFVECMASCHALAMVKDRVIGDPLDKEMFNGTHWKLEEVLGREDKIVTFMTAADKPKEKAATQLGIVKRFDFNSKLQRMSVFVRNMNTGKIRLYTKGSPEKLSELSRPETIPNNFTDVLSLYTQKGCRVLALATRALDIDAEGCERADREEIEKNLDFLGFLIMKNSIKKVTEPIIAVLSAADIRSIMVTGDNGFTAITVAKECGIIRPESKVYLGELQELQGLKCVSWTSVADSSGEKGKEKQGSVTNHTKTDLEKVPSDHDSPGRETLRVQQDPTTLRLCGNDPWTEGEDYTLAITGKAWDFLFEEDPKSSTEQMKMYLAKTAVFARMSPESKATLIDALQNTGLTVGMCGDGANDCVALKTADVGISLSDTEASVAAPFTSRTPDISCVVKLLREGRAALTTSFQCFKYMALYSMIQFVTVILLYSLDKNMTDPQYLIVDLFLLLPLAVTMSYTKAASKLSKQLPNAELLSFPILSSILGQTIIQGGVQVFFFFFVKSRDWYEPPLYDDEIDANDSENHMCHANTVVFLISLMQYVSTVVAFSIGKPFRKPMGSNIAFMINVVIVAVYAMYVILVPDSWNKSVFGLNYDDYDTLKEENYTAIIAFVVIVNAVVTYLYEEILMKIFARKKYDKIHP